jgi:Glycogen recognition site of AMP-activated protein kinase
MGIIKNYQPSKGTCKVTFSFGLNEAEGVKTIQVLGDFNNWDDKVAPKLKKGKEDFSTSVELNAGQSYEFKYLLDGSRWENDFSADGYVVTPFSGVSNSVLVLDAVAEPVVEKVAKSDKTASPKETKPAAAKVETKTAKPAPAKSAKVAAPTATKLAAPKAEKVAAPKATKVTTVKSDASKGTKTTAPKAPKAPKAAK